MLPMHYTDLQGRLTEIHRMNRLFFLALGIWIFSGLHLEAQTNLFVAADGSAPFKSVQEAVMSVPSGSNTNPVIIHIKPGVYKGLIYLQREKRFFKLVGESATNTVLTFGLYASLTNFDGKPIGTFHTPSTTIDADDFTAENLTFENSAGAVGQALAIRVDGDRASFRNCRFLGWQDTILLNRGRHILKIVTSPARWILFLARRRHGLRSATSTVSAAATSPLPRRRLMNRLDLFSRIAKSPGRSRAWRRSSAGRGGFTPARFI